MNILTLNTLNDDKVIVRGNGGNSGGGESGSTMVYLDWTNTSAADRVFMSSYAFAVKGVAQDMIGIFPTGLYSVMQGKSSDVKAVAIDLSFEIALNIEGVSQIISIEQQLIEGGINLSAFPRLTKEEFYTI